MKLELHTSKSGDTIIVSMKGRIDADTAPEVEQKFNTLMLKNKYNLIADMRELNFISSAGLRVLLATLKETRKNGGDLRLACLQADVVKVLEMTGFVNLFKIYQSVKGAIKSF